MTAASLNILRLDAVTRSFGGVVALDAVSLAIGAGEIVCLAGRSGCGKSTLLRVVAGVEDVDSGTVALDGQTVTGGTAFVAPEARNVGLMFQDYALFPHLTARQNIAFGLKALGRSKARARVNDIVERLDIAALADRYPHMLSGGEQQRVALARALAPQPHVLLMDEPFSNLDRGLRDSVREETMALLRSLGTTAIIVTHDPEEALALGDRVVLMQQGRVVETGTGEAIYTRPRTAYAATFFSRVNAIPARRSGEWVECVLGRFAASPGVGAATTLYVRPEAVRLAGQGIVARVSDRTLMGEIEEIALDIAGLDRPLVMRTTHRPGLQVGDEVAVSVAAEDALLFPEADQEAGQ